MAHTTTRPRNDEDKLTNINSFFDTGDILYLAAANGSFIQKTADALLTANGETKSLAALFNVEVNEGRVLLKSEGRYVRVDPTTREIKVDAARPDAAELMFLADQFGSPHLDTDQSGYFETDIADRILRQSDIEEHSLLTSFDFGLERIATRDFDIDFDELDDCQKAWAQLAFDLTVGFFLAIGLGPFVSEGKAAPGVLKLIQTNKKAAKAIDDILKAIKNNKKIATSALLSFMGVCYWEGILWDILKIVLVTAGWYVLGRALSKIIEIVFLPEVEAADLLASFLIWNGQTVKAALDVAEKCKGEDGHVCSVTEVKI